MGKEGGEMLSMRTDLKIKFESKIILLSCSVANDVKISCCVRCQTEISTEYRQVDQKPLFGKVGHLQVFLSRAPSKFLF